MDTMITTKVAAALCGSFLVFLLGKWAAEEIYHMDSHGDASYVIDTGAEETASDEPEVSFEEMLASADIGKGANVFRKCSACQMSTWSSRRQEAGRSGRLSPPMPTRSPGSSISTWSPRRNSCGSASPP